MNKYKILMKNQQYMKDLIANIISRLGDGIDTLALSWLVFKLTGSLSLLAFSFAINALPNVLFGLFSGVIVTHFPKKTFVFTCDLIRGILVFIMAILFYVNRLNIALLFTITFFISLVETFRTTASASLRPFILAKEHYCIGVSFGSSLYQLSQLIGLTLAPLIIQTFDILGALVIDAATFLICAIIIRTVKSREVLSEGEKLSIKRSITDFSSSIKYIKNRTFILYLCIFGAIINALFVPIDSLSVAFIAGLGMKSEGIAYIQVPLLIGTCIGGWFYPRLSDKVKVQRIFISAGIVLGITYVFIAQLPALNHVHTIPILICLSCILGISLIMVNLPISIAVLSKIDVDYLPNISGISNAFALCSIPITSCIIGVLGKYTNVYTIFIIFGVLTLLVFIGQIWNKKLYQFN